MKKPDLYACYLNQLNENEVDLISEFWELGDKKSYPYRFRLRELAEKFGIKNQNGVAKFVAENSFISSNSSNFNCSCCNKKFQSKGRTEFMELLKRDSQLLCKECLQEQVNNLAADRGIQLESETKTLHLPTFEEISFQSLSYLNKVALLAMILETDSKESEPVQLTKDELVLSGSDENDEKILRELFLGGAIHIVDEGELNHTPLLQDTRNFLSKNLDFIDVEIIDRFNTYVRKTPKPGLYFLVPTNLDGLDEYKSHLFADVINSEITELDAEAIKEFVINNRFYQAYQLLNTVISYHKIPVDMNVKLDSVLVALIKNYSLPEAFNILNYQAKNVAAKLYSEPTMASYIQNKLLAKYIESYMIYLREKGKTTYSIRLPDYIIGSKIEYFSSYYILGELTSWNELSANEIIEKWLNSPTVKINA